MFITTRNKQHFNTWALCGTQLKILSHSRLVRQACPWSPTGVLSDYVSVYSVITGGNYWSQDTVKCVPAL